MNLPTCDLAIEKDRVREKHIEKQRLTECVGYFAIVEQRFSIYICIWKSGWTRNTVERSRLVRNHFSDRTGRRPSVASPEGPPYLYILYIHNKPPSPRHRTTILKHCETSIQIVHILFCVIVKNNYRYESTCVFSFSVLSKAIYEIELRSICKCIQKCNTTSIPLKNHILNHTAIAAHSTHIHTNPCEIKSDPLQCIPFSLSDINDLPRSIATSGCVRNFVRQLWINFIDNVPALRSNQNADFHGIGCANGAGVLHIRRWGGRRQKGVSDADRRRRCPTAQSTSRWVETRFFKSLFVFLLYIFYLNSVRHQFKIKYIIIVNNFSI